MAHDIQNFSIPRQHRARLIEELGEESALKRFQTLERLTYAYARKWNLRIRQVADSENVSLCIFCTDQGGREVVLKLPIDRVTGTQEHLALETWKQSGAAPRPLQFDPVSGVILMERLYPGLQARAETPQAAANSLNDLAARLYGPAPDASLPDLPHLADTVRTRLQAARTRLATPENWYSAFFKPADVRREEQQLQDLLDLAQERAEYQLARPQRTTLLHGDLRPRNLLSAQKSTFRWMAIDPCPCLGDPHADLGLAMATQSDHPISALLEELSTDPRWDAEVLADWTLVWAVATYDPAKTSLAAVQRAFLTSDKTA